VAEENGRLLGHVALERTGDAAVLRSLVVAPSAQGQGLARRLLGLAENQAGHRILLLKTRTIGPWVERRGYCRANPGQIPESVRGTTEFEGSLCSGYPAYVKPVAGVEPAAAFGSPLASAGS
jgi:amino-acid N-acetyltransferase